MAKKEDKTRDAVIDRMLTETVTKSTKSKFHDKYNTPLSPEEENKFLQWAKQESSTSGRNVLLDMEDFDLQGFWKSGGSFDGGHGPDTWKKPNHPTFSNQSQYNGVDGFFGGQWTESQNGRAAFKASETNLRMRPPEALRQYFQAVEPDVDLIF